MHPGVACEISRQQEHNGKQVESEEVSAALGVYLPG